MSKKQRSHNQSRAKLLAAAIAGRAAKSDYRRGLLDGVSLVVANLNIARARRNGRWARVPVTVVGPRGA